MRRNQQILIFYAFSEGFFIIFSYFYSTMITEVQITCIVLMGLITLFLAFSLHRYTANEKVINNARKLLTGGTILVMIHFTFQYILHKNENNVEDTRTMFNMIFGIPITYFVDLSYLYLQREGRIQKIEWLYGPSVFFLSILILAIALLSKQTEVTLPFANKITAIIYSTVLIYYGALQLFEYFKIRRTLGNDHTHYLRTLLKWTKFSMFTVIVVSLGFPFMTFNTNLLMRSLYGILSISSAFFYILCFIGFCLNYSIKTNVAFAISKAEKEEKGQTATDQKTELMASIAEDFVRSGYYLQAGITVKDVAIRMGVSCNMLKSWLHSTEYDKFNTWITYLRIEKSKELLVNNPYLNSEEIAEQCGFCDRQYFQQLFKKQEGVSPYKWLKEKQLSNLQGNRPAPQSLEPEQSC